MAAMRWPGSTRWPIARPSIESRCPYSVKKRQAGDFVAQQNHRPVIEPLSVVRERVYGSSERSVDRRSGRSKKIETDVYGSVLIGRIRTGSKRRSRIDRSRFVIAADADSRARIAHFPEQRFGERRRFQRLADRRRAEGCRSSDRKRWPGRDRSTGAVFKLRTASIIAAACGTAGRPQASRKR